MTNDAKERSISTPIMALIFIGVAAVVLWDTTSYTDADSFVFPRAIALVMACLAVLSIIRWFVVPSAEEVSFGGSNLRRLGLVLVMLGATIAMPWIGFLLSGLIAFGVILALAMYDPWTPMRLVVYPLAGAGIVLGFYFLFSNVLQVPLPVGTMFGG